MRPVLRQAERHERDRAALDELIEAITVNAYSDDEKLRALFERRDRVHAA
jgi:hypothetical protein